MRPTTINDLDDVSEDQRDAYVPAGDGTFTLHPELVELEEHHAANLAALDAKIERRSAQLIDTLASSEITDTLLKAGVDLKLVPALSALIRQQMKFELEELDEGFRVVVADAYGEVGVAFAVNTWLATEEADAFRPAPKATDGPLMERLRQLRASMQ